MKKILIIIFSTLISNWSCANASESSTVNFKNSPPKEISTGAEQLDKYLTLLKGKQIAICGNQTSRIGTTHLVDTLFALNVNIVKIFSPEHGFRGEAEAGASVGSSVDPLTGIPIVSLYGNNKKPTNEQMKGIDIILFDIQDVGCRFYTYISTLHYIMESAAENNVEVIILDRPNPNGYFIDGPVMEEGFTSFVGMHPVPIVHGMTIGEYGRMINGESWLRGKISCSLTIIPMENYTHLSRYSLPYSPSPNLPTDEAIYLYPSLCLFEGTDISLGRGTDIPFQVYGHPLLQSGDYYFIPQPIKGVSENPTQKGKKCRGYDLTNWAKERIGKENSVNLSFLLEAYRQFPTDKEFFTHADFFDKLAGNNTLRQQIKKGMTESEIRQSWEPLLDDFKEKRKNYLLYPDFY